MNKFLLSMMMTATVVTAPMLHAYSVNNAHQFADNHKSDVGDSNFDSSKLLSIDEPHVKQHNGRNDIDKSHDEKLKNSDMDDAGLESSKDYENSDKSNNHSKLKSKENSNFKKGNFKFDAKKPYKNDMTSANEDSRDNEEKDHSSKLQGVKSHAKLKNKGRKFSFQYSDYNKREDKINSKLEKKVSKDKSKGFNNYDVSDVESTY